MKNILVVFFCSFLVACSGSLLPTVDPANVPSQLGGGIQQREILGTPSVTVLTSGAASERVVIVYGTPTKSAMALAIEIHDAAQATSDAAALEVARLGVARAGTDAAAQKYAIDATSTLTVLHLTAVAAQSESDARIAASNADTERSKLAQMDADNQNLILENEAAQIAAETQGSRVGAVLSLIVLVIVGIGVVTLLCLFRHREHEYAAAVAGAEAQAAKPPDYPGTAFHPVQPLAPGGSLVPRVIPAFVPEPVWIKFCQNVITSKNKSGIPFTRSWWVDRNGMKDAEWDAINAYLFENDYAMSTNPDVANSVSTITPEGERCLSGFLNDPLPQVGETPISAQLSSDSPPRQGKNTEGEEVTDDNS